MCQDEDPTTALMKTYGIKGTAQSEDYVAPALSPWRTMIEFSEQLTKCCLLGVELHNARTCEPIKNAKFFFTQTFVNNE